VIVNDDLSTLMVRSSFMRCDRITRRWHYIGAEPMRVHWAYSGTIGERLRA
jgi:hypothetical protein